MLELQGRVEKPARATPHLEVLVAWEPLPAAYTPAQLNRTGCYSQPQYVAAAVYRHRPRAQLGVTAAHCVTPREADLLSAQRPGPPAPESYTLPFLVRERWDAYGLRFTLRLEVEDLLATHGDGIYTVSLWGHVETQRALLGQYAVVVGERSDLW